MSYIDQVRGVNVLQDWDNFFANKMADYYAVKEDVTGEWFTVDNTGVDTAIIHDSSSVLQEINSTRLPLIMKSIRQDIVLICVITGPNIAGNVYSLEKKQIYVVEIFNRATGMFYTPQELVAFTNKISVNPYGSKFLPGPVVGLVDFKAAVQAVKDLEDDSNTSEVEAGVLSSLDLLLHTPSLVNSNFEKKGLLFAGLFGYTFNYN